MKSKLLIGIIIFLLGCFVGAYIRHLFSSDSSVEQNTITHSLVVNKIESMGNLEVVKYSIQDIMEYKKMRQWLPNAKTALLIKGEIIACVDLSKITEDKVVVSGDSIALLLPPPELCNVKIDHSQSKIYDISYGLWESAELLDQGYKYAQMELERRAHQINLTDEARHNTILILTPMLNAMGFHSVTILFDDNLSQYK